MKNLARLLILNFVCILLVTFAADTPAQTTGAETKSPQTQKNLTKKKRKKTVKVLFEPTAYEKTILVITKGKEWKYFRFSAANPLKLEVEGTTVLDFRVRLLFDATMKGSQTFTITLEEQGMLMKSAAASYSFSAQKSRISTVKGEPALVPSTGDEFKFTVPNGKHTYIVSLKGTSAPAAAMRVLIPKKDLEPKKSARANSWRFRASLQTRYDDNVFQYSERNIRVFDASLPKFSGLSSPDDVITMPYFGARHDIGKHGRLSLSAEPRIYARNEVKNSQTYTALWRQDVSRRNRLMIQYEFVPSNFYSRLANPPNQTRKYADADYRRNSVQAEFQRQLQKNFRGDVRGKYSRRNFNETFDYLDGNIWNSGGDLIWLPTRRLQIAASVDYERYLAGGRDVNYEASYREWEGSVAPGVRIFPRLLARGILRYAARDYTTDVARDLSHFRRHDWTAVVKAEVVAKLAQQWDALIGYQYTRRTSNRLGVFLAFANYEENRVYGDFEYHF